MQLKVSNNLLLILILVAAKIQELIPNIVVYINEVPKIWVDHEIYC